MGLSRIDIKVCKKCSKYLDPGSLHDVRICATHVSIVFRNIAYMTKITRNLFFMI